MTIRANRIGEGQVQSGPNVHTVVGALRLIFIQRHCEAKRPGH